LREPEISRICGFLAELSCESHADRVVQAWPLFERFHPKPSRLIVGLPRRWFGHVLRSGPQVGGGAYWLEDPFTLSPSVDVTKETTWALAQFFVQGRLLIKASYRSFTRGHL
jgi:hypothetical protein